MNALPEPQFKNLSAIAPLGQGVNRLLPSDPDKLSITYLPLALLDRWESQPRTYLDPEKIEKLRLSIKKRKGLDWPLVVRPKGNRFERIAGERRFTAASLEKLGEVPCIIRHLTDEEAREVALTENIHREDLNPIEELEALLNLLTLRLEMASSQVSALLYQMKHQLEILPASERSGGDNVIPNPQDSTQQLLAQTFAEFGYNWYSYTCNRLKLLKLPECLYQAVLQGKIDYTKVLLLKKLKEPQAQKTLLEDAIAQNWSVEKLREKVKVHLAPTQTSFSETGQRLNQISRQLKSLKLWKKDPKTWKKVERYLQNIEQLLANEQISE